MSLRKRKKFTALARVKLLAPSVLSGVPTPPAAAMLNAPLAKSASRLRLAERSTFANRTFTRICASLGGTSTRSRFTGFPSVEAIATTRSAATTSFTVPRTKTVSLSKVMLMSSSGYSRASCRRAASSFAGLGRTTKSYVSRLPPFCQTISEVSPGALPLMSTSLGLLATTSARVPSATEIRSIGNGLSITSDMPTVTVHFSTGALWPEPFCI